MTIPTFSLEGPVGLTEERTDEPTSGVQYAVLDPNGKRTAYGDQSWVAYGNALTERWGYTEDGHQRGDLIHPDGKIQRRTITISYGEWEDA